MIWLRNPHPPLDSTEDEDSETGDCAAPWGWRVVGAAGAAKERKWMKKNASFQSTGVVDQPIMKD